MKIVAYTDGSYDSNRNAYGGGVVLLVEGMPNPLEYKVGGKDSNHARLRNIAGEILGAMAALEIAKSVKCDHLVLYHDYEGLSKWVNGEWKTKKRFTEAYRLAVEEARKVMEVEFKWVRGHSNNKYNDLADRLAKEAVRDA